MAATGYKEFSAGPEHGSSPPVMRCRLCDTDLGQDWPDLSKLDPLGIKNHPLDAWRAAADWGCPFCNIITSVLDHSWKQYGCYDSFYFKDPEKARDPEMQGFQVLLHANGKGQYLLSLEHINMPLLVGPDAGTEEVRVRGTITIYLDGKACFSLSSPLSPNFPSHRNCVQSILMFSRSRYIQPEIRAIFQDSQPLRFPRRPRTCTGLALDMPRPPP